LDGFINEVEINISDNKSKYVIDEKNRDLEYNVFLSSSDNFYNNKKVDTTKIIKDVESKSTKGQNFDQNNDENILEDDLTIIGLGK
jgi:hypothetical protein